MVGKTGVAPAWTCARQPLKLVRLLIPPLAHVVLGVRLELTDYGL